MHIRNTVSWAVVLLFSLFAAADAADTANTSPPPPAQFSPMTSHERLGNYVSGLGSPEAIIRAAASAGIAQAGGTPREWGGGAEGFGYRIGNAFAQHVIRDTVQYGIAATLHEDNRYFVSGETGLLPPYEVRTEEYVPGTARQRRSVFLLLAYRRRGGIRVHFTRMATE